MEATTLLDGIEIEIKIMRIEKLINVSIFALKKLKTVPLRSDNVLINFDFTNTTLNFEILISNSY